jgi:hypothetical protein
LLWLTMEVFLLLRYFFVFLFATCFFVQVWDQIHKFFSKDTTLIFETRPDPNLMFPTLAFCPERAFRDKVMRDELKIGAHTWSTDVPNANQTLWSRPSSREELDLWYQKSTFGQADLFGNVQYYDAKEEKRFTFFDKLDPLLKNDDVGTFEEIMSTVYGKCSILQLTRPVGNIADFIRVTLRFPQDMRALKVFAFEKGLQHFGIGRDYWIGNFKVFHLMPNGRFNLGLVKKTRLLNPDSSNCHKSLTNADWTKCLMEDSIRILRDAPDILSEGCKLCYWPLYHAWTRNFSFCQTFSDVVCTSRALGSAMLRANAQRSCLRPCQIEEYVFQERASPFPTDQAEDTYFYAYFNTIDVEFSREHMLYDLNSIIAAVGGSLGLFLGFSFLEFVLKAMTYFQTKGCWKLKKKFISPK